MRGRRVAPQQEDAHAMAMGLGVDGKTGFFAVFDGHGGKEVAKYVALYMVRLGVVPATNHGMVSK